MVAACGIANFFAKKLLTPWAATNCRLLKLNDPNPGGSICNGI
ncbi:MAG: hypothetical protein WCE84_01100 [Candidatus Rhabdochlamydia sp.]